MREEKTRQGQGHPGTRNSMTKGPTTKHKLKRGNECGTQRRKGRVVLAEPEKGRHHVKYLGHLPKSDRRPAKTLGRQRHVQNYLLNQSLWIQYDNRGWQRGNVGIPVKRLLFLPEGRTE